MRVPVPEGQQIQSAALPGVRSDLDTRNALSSVGQGIQEAASGIHAAYQKSIAAAATDGENQWSSRALDIEHGTADGQTKGFFQTQGQETLAGSADTITALQKVQQDIAGKMAPGAKELFLARTNALLTEHRRSIESYTASQGEALNRVTAETRTDVAARTASLNYANDKLVATETAAAESALATQLHGMPGDVVQRSIDGVRQKVAAARLQGAIQAKDVAAAQSIFAAHKGDLGEQAPQYQHLVQTMVDAQLGQKNAQALIDAARRPNGSVDEDLVTKGYEATPASARTPAFHEALQQRLALEKKAWDDKKSNVFGTALSAYLQGGQQLGAIDAPSRAWLTQNAPQEWARLEQMDRSWNRRGGVNSAGSTEQIAALNEVRYEMAQEPEKFAAMSPAELARQWAPQLSSEGFKEIGKAHATLVASLRKPEKLAAPVYKSVINTAAHAFGEVNPKTGIPRAPAGWSAEHHQLLDDVVNAVTEQDSAYRQAHGGQSAPPEQLEKWAQAQLVRRRVQGTGVSVFGHVFGGTEETAIEAAKKGDVLEDGSGERSAQTGLSTDNSATSQGNGAAVAREVTSYRYNKARTMRIPVYSDGTQGAPESAQ